MSTYGAFWESAMPRCVSLGPSSTQATLVDIFTAESGAEDRYALWSRPRGRYEVLYGPRESATVEEVLAFYVVADGPLRGFRLRDWNDYRSSGFGETSPTDQPLVDLTTHDGSLEIPIYKTWRIAHREKRVRIWKPCACGFRLAVDGVEITEGWTLDPTRGRVCFDALPDGDCITWGGFYDKPVRFDGEFQQEAVAGDVGAAGSIMLKELPDDENELFPASEDDEWIAHLGPSDAELRATSERADAFSATAQAWSF